jgi:HSP20 family molecular chaperone IbpA
MPLVPVRQGVLKRRKIDRATKAIIRRARQFLARLAHKGSDRPVSAVAPIFATVPCEIKEHSGEITVRVPILGFSAMELYVIPDWDVLTIEGRAKQKRTFDGSNWIETIEKRLTHRLHFDFELDPNRITATLNETTVEIVAHKMRQ